VEDGVSSWIGGVSSERPGVSLGSLPGVHATIEVRTMEQERRATKSNFINFIINILAFVRHFYHYNLNM